MLAALRNGARQALCPAGGQAGKTVGRATRRTGPEGAAEIIGGPERSRQRTRPGKFLSRLQNGNADYGRGVHGQGKRNAGQKQ